MTLQESMLLAINQAKKAKKSGEVPVGSVIIDETGKVIASAYNQVISRHDPTAHAEINAIREACRLIKNYRLNEMILFVTLEPCLMCANAIAESRIKRVVYGASDYQEGTFNSADNKYLLKHQNYEVIGGILEEDCSKILKDFFRERR